MKQREIKFRVWSVKMRYFTFEEMCEPEFFGNPENVMQYTGLKDKRGVEIYEGDIMGECWDKSERIKELKTTIKEIKEEGTKKKNEETFSGGSTGLYENYFFEHSRSKPTLLSERIKIKLKELEKRKVFEVKLEKYNDGEGYCDNEHYGYHSGGITLIDAIDKYEIIGNIYKNKNLLK